MKKHLENHWGKMLLALATVALVGSIVYSQQVAQQANEGVILTENVKGNADASVSLVKYSDFQCPACGQFASYVDQFIIPQYGDQLRFEYRHFPLINIHPNAIPAARAAEAAAQQGAFWPMHDRLFANQQQWSGAASPDAIFIQYAEELGLDVATFRRHLGASVIREAITDSFNEARGLGFTGTPTFMLNGERMQFATFDEFQQQIVAAITGDTTSDEAAPATEATADVEFGI
jgi:protein-disulfide isomerase